MWRSNQRLWMRVGRENCALCQDLWGRKRARSEARNVQEGRIDLSWDWSFRQVLDWKPRSRAGCELGWMVARLAPSSSRVD